MQAVILAAGRGTRMGNATEDTPKPLLKVAGKTLLEYKLESLPDEINEVVIVVGYLNHKIREYLGDSYKKVSITYVEQKELNGTAGALLAAKDILKDRFIVLMGDDIYAQEDMHACVTHKWAICGKEVSNQERGGELLVDSNGNLQSIHESKHYITKGVVNTGMYMMHKSFFDHEMVKVENTDEYGIPHTLVQIAKKEEIPVMVSTHHWIQISNQDDLKTFESNLGTI